MILLLTLIVQTAPESILQACLQCLNSVFFEAARNLGYETLLATASSLVTLPAFMGGII